MQCRYNITSPCTLYVGRLSRISISCNIILVNLSLTLSIPLPPSLSPSVPLARPRSPSLYRCLSWGRQYLPFRGHQARNQLSPKGGSFFHQQSINAHTKRSQNVKKGITIMLTDNIILCEATYDRTTTTSRLP